MTDYRRTEEDLWDEDVVADEDRLMKVLPVPDRDGREPAAVRPEGDAVPGEAVETADAAVEATAQSLVDERADQA